MTYLFLHPIMHLLLFLSPDSLSYKFTRFFYFICLSLTKGQCSNVRLYYPYWQYADLFIFRFVSLLCLRSTLRLFNIDPFFEQRTCGCLPNFPGKPLKYRNMHPTACMHVRCIRNGLVRKSKHY